jgi:hypothetical protein
MTETAILVRTHYADAQVRGMIEALAASSAHPVYALVDESRGPVDFGQTPKIAFDAGLPGVLGLYGAVDKLYWRCGDYGLYAARQALPEVERLWLIEPDVRLHQARPGAFFDRFAEDPADLLISHLRPAEATWDWGKTMADGGPVWRCLFPLLRISARALDALLEARRDAGPRFVAAGRDPQFWPNDEVFVATTLMRAGFDCRDLNASGEVYDPQSFGYWWPISDRQLEAQGREGFAYHPVLNGEAYFRKLFHLATRLRDFAALEAAIEALTGIEWSEQQAEQFRRAVELAKSVGAGVEAQVAAA